MGRVGYARRWLFGWGGNLTWWDGYVAPWAVFVGGEYELWPTARGAPAIHDRRTISMRSA